MYHVGTWITQFGFGDYYVSVSVGLPIKQLALNEATTATTSTPTSISIIATITTPTASKATKGCKHLARLD